MTRSSSELPVIYSSSDDKLVIEAVVREVQKYDADIHYLRVFVTLGFVQHSNQRLHTLYFELGQELAREQSGYRLLNYFVKSKSASVYQITFVCRYVGIVDLAYTPPPKGGILSRIFRMTG